MTAADRVIWTRLPGSRAEGLDPGLPPRAKAGAKDTVPCQLTQTPRGRRVLSKDRMEGFSDGVFGFAITLLVLDIALRPPGRPLQQLLHAWPFYLAYVISFLTIGGAWLATPP
jgi:hypothetical protein